MSQENVEIVRALFDRWNRGETAAALELIDPEIEVEATIRLFDVDEVYRGHARCPEAA
jgi:ketosteroid isomerase-like protein